MSQLIEGTTMTDNLLPCPFCGGDARADSHADDCYFTLHRALNKAPDGDASLQLEVLEAWNRRAAIEARAAVPAGWRALAERCLSSMQDAVRFVETGIGRPPSQTCLFEIEELRAMLAAAPQPVAQPSEHVPEVHFGKTMKPETLRVELQKMCSAWGTYWRGSDAHGVELTTEQAVELLQNALNVEVEIKDEEAVAQAKPEQAACEQTIKNELPMLSISDEQAEAIASEVYARNPVDSVDAAFKLDWELVRAGVSHAKALSTDDSCPHGNAHMVHDCLRCGAPVCCGKCCADDAANEPNVAGKIAYQLTKKLVIDMPTARAAVDAAIAALPVSQPLTQEQRRALIDAAGDKTDGLNQDDFADEIVRAVERRHGITASPKD